MTAEALLWLAKEPLARRSSLRDTCATQLLNAGCRVTSIQRFLGHKELSSTMVYARAHDQTVAEDYFAAMERVEQRLEIVPTGRKDMEVVKVQEPEKLMQLIEQLEMPELRFEERLGITGQLREIVGVVNEHVTLKESQKQMELINFQQDKLSRSLILDHALP